MYELLTEAKTRPYLKGVRKKRLPSIERRRVQERDLQLARAAQNGSMPRAPHDGQRGTVLGRLGLRLAAGFRSLR